MTVVARGAVTVAYIRGTQSISAAGIASRCLTGRSGFARWSASEVDMRKFVIVALLGSLTACGPSQSERPVVSPEAVAQADTARLVAYLDAEFEEELAMTPERATSLGRKDNYDKLNDYSEAQQDRLLEWRRTSVANMKAKFDRAKLSS